MRNYLFKKYFSNILRSFFFISIAVISFLFLFFSKSFSEENVFTINDVAVKGEIDLNFSREKYINKAFVDSFDILMNKILLSSDLVKIDKIELEQIKRLVKNFQIIDEKFSKNEYKAKFKLFYNEAKVKNFLGKKNISFSQPDNISAVFFPVFFINNEIQSFGENFFYKKWNEIKIKNELINFILPIDDLEDVSQIIKMKNKIEELNIERLVNKYNVKSYVFALMDYQDSKLNIHIKTNFNNNKISKNFLYNIESIKDEKILTNVLSDLKIKITDLWKEENLINILMPLSIRVQYQYKDLKDLDKLRNILYNMSIINSYTLEEFNIKNSFFKIYYYGNPKKLRSELVKFGYYLKNDQGYWRLYLNE